jgi:hypothetical protein
MIWDVVWIGTLLTTVTAFIGFFVFLHSVIRRTNGTYADAYVCVLLLAFGSNYWYLWYARDTMYRDPERYLFILNRTDYFPLVYFVWIILVFMICHKIMDIRKRRKEE